MNLILPISSVLCVKAKKGVGSCVRNPPSPCVLYAFEIKPKIFLYKYKVPTQKGLLLVEDKTNFFCCNYTYSVFHLPHPPPLSSLSTPGVFGQKRGQKVRLFFIIVLIRFDSQIANNPIAVSHLFYLFCHVIDICNLTALKKTVHKKNDFKYTPQLLQRILNHIKPQEQIFPQHNTKGPYSAQELPSLGTTHNTT